MNDSFVVVQDGGNAMEVGNVKTDGVVEITADDAAWIGVNNFADGSSAVSEDAVCVKLTDETKMVIDQPGGGSNASIATSGLARIFRKVVCCGDSYTSGHIDLDDEDAVATNEEHAWPFYAGLITGQEWLNAGQSGANVFTWQTGSRGLSRAKSFGKAQAYIVGLMINDAGDWGSHVDVGSPSDIGTDNGTYYAGLSEIVRELAAINSDAKIFLNTCPRTNPVYDPYNEAVRTIVKTYSGTYNVHCIDLLEGYIDWYRLASINSDSVGGHFTAIGYEQFAEVYVKALHDYIAGHISEFQDVFKIEYDDVPIE